MTDFNGITFENDDKVRIHDLRGSEEDIIKSIRFSGFGWNFVNDDGSYYAYMGALYGTHYTFEILT